MGQRIKLVRNNATGNGTLEKTRLKLGFIPLTDCAPLAIAAERGFFARHGLQVELKRQPSWAAIRDQVALGVLDGAHMLAGMPIASTLGIGGQTVPMVTALSLDLNGNAITVSNELYRRMHAADPVAMADRPLTARALKQVIAEDRAEGLAPLTFAMVHPVSSHNYQLRYWLASAGIDPDNDLRIIVIPPPRMGANLRAGRIDGYCVGEPWNQAVVADKLGVSLITGYEIWNNAPEKVLGVTRDWAEKHPNTHRALVRALVEAALWMDDPDHRDEAARLICVADYVNAPAAVIRRTLAGQFQYHPEIAATSLPDFNVFHRYAANFPWRSHALWFVTQMQRWGQLDRNVDARAAAAQVYLPDTYRAAVEPLQLAVPGIDEKTEGSHSGPWMLDTPSGVLSMGADSFFDGAVFDPATPKKYLQTLDALNPKTPPTKPTLQTRS